MAPLTVRYMGRVGVNVDNNPLDLEDDQLTQAQNAVASDPAASGASSVHKRPGLAAFNSSTLTYIVLGGAALPGPNLSTGGTITVYISRSPIS